MRYSILLLIITSFIACTDKPQSVNANDLKAKKYIAHITELSDSTYPDNPDISIRHQLDGTFSHSDVEIIQNEEGIFTFKFIPSSKNVDSDTLLVPNVSIMEMIPSFPDWVKDDPYLIHIGLINQEWNRQQVQFYKNQFTFSSNNLESKSIVRVDIARNCLNSYLWEVITYAQNENGKERPCYHGWFNFPKDLYSSLFLHRNKESFQKHKNHLENWKDPEQKKIDFSKLRVEDKLTVEFLTKENKKLKSYNHQYYPLIGERKKKAKNIIKPEVPTSIKDFLNDSTLFATFTAPGYYNTKTPRRTYLSKLGLLEKVVYMETTAPNIQHDKTFELKLIFSSTSDAATSYMLIGGLKKENIPVLSTKEAHKGFQMPMGISNHSFYETYDHMLANPSKQNPYYGLLLNEDEKFMDSHWLGIDGPLFHWDNKKRNLLHIWILSFERHAFVGHYTIQL